jgi:arylsulfatase A-like enzyme
MAEKMNAILIVLDSLRKDHVGCYGNDWISTPNLDALAKESVMFTRAYPESLPTLPFRRSLYTGCRGFPFEGHIAHKGDFVSMSPGWGPMREDRDSLAELLQMRYYRTTLISDCYHQFKPSMNFHRGFSQWQWIRGQESDPYKLGPSISKEELQKYMPENLRNPFQIQHVMKQYLKNVRGRKSEKDYFGPQVFRAATDWINSHSGDGHFFLTIESFDPHEPWDPPDEYVRLYDKGNGPARNVITSLYGPADQLTEAELKRLRANYAGEVTMVDRWLGVFTDSVRDRGLMDNTLIAVVSDHGHCVGEHNLVSKQGHPLCPEVADLVMLIRFPDGTGAGKTCENFVYNHDIAPTLLNYLGVSGSKRMNGRDLRPLIEGGSPLYDHVTVGYGPFVMVRDDDWWYNAYLWGDLGRLYYLPDDPGLENNVAKGNEKIIEQMHAWAIEDAGGNVPELLKDLAGMNVPGCTPMEAQLDIQ